MSIVIFSVYFLISGIIMPALSITPGSIREALSIPFQQTARYIKELGDEVTDEEKETIDKILDYDLLAEVYEPELSDYVKGTYNESASRAELLDYFKVWFQMFLKHPNVYLEATINNYYAYFYPSPTTFETYSYSVIHYMTLNERLKEVVITDFAPSKFLNKYGTVLEEIQEIISYIPGLSIVQSAATYTWTLILWFFYCIRKKRKDSLLSTIPLILMVLVCIASPVNGWYWRYIHPTAVALPGIILLNYFSDDKIRK